jgi:hypothetical protein
MDDNIYVVTLLNSPADVIVTSGSSSGRFSVNGGLKNVTMAFQQGAQVRSFLFFLCCTVG